MPLPRTPTHSSDMRKDSVVQAGVDIDRREELKGILVTIFVCTGMFIIVTIGVVALIIKGLRTKKNLISFKIIN